MQHVVTKKKSWLVKIIYLVVITKNKLKERIIDRQRLTDQGFHILDAHWYKESHKINKPLLNHSPFYSF